MSEKDLQLLKDLIPYLIPIIIIQYALVIAAIIDLARREKTRGPKVAWVFIILIVNFIGPILYFVIGRDEG
ncbi:MAG: PLD nuclease N-terminal domain-containing protein [Candidatus Promineifilaceae bacterium]